MDIALLEVLVEHHNNGDHAQNGWKSHVYVAVITNVREKCNVTITKENIILRCKTFEKHYEAISKMRSQSGFGWDWVNNKLSIDSEDVWTKYVVANNKIAFYKNRVIKNWDAITTIYSNDHANGEGVGTSIESVVEPTVGNMP
uniref:Myb/SANT-like domain-containing protein n=1 Tax=Hordeum vulgare subsp. vulgare TaxID=112509 RepID=A0A8I6YLX8_HORVV